MNDFGRRGGTAASSAAQPTEMSMLVRILDLADAIQERVSEALAALDLSYPKYEVLKHLLEAGEPVTLGVLAERQSCARSNITQMVDRLEADGLVRRVADAEDRRSIRAELTGQGAIRAQEGAHKMDEVIQQFEATLSETERDQMRRLLGKLG
jgi:DNA-binding MarR family transcriptional regulator